MKTEEYFKRLEKEVRSVYEIAGEARKKGLDPSEEVETPLAMSMAEKIVGLIATVYPQVKGSGIDKRILELEKEYGKLDVNVAFHIAEEVAKQKFCKFSSLVESIDAGIRVAFAYETLAVVSSPIEGFTGLELGKTKDGKDYFIANFSGPIRSAGTTASCVVLMLIDYLREFFGFAKYDPTEDEVKRVFTELEDYHQRVTNLQYHPTEEEVDFLARNLPIQISGEPSEKIEVSNYKDLERVKTNFIRSGFCLVFAEGLAQKAAKGYRLLKQAKNKGIKSTGFDFIDEYLKIHEKKTAGKKDSTPTYMKDLVAGRPMFGQPSRSGGFRFRYGRGRISGFSAASVHPATMAITDGFIAIGTQLKIEKPTKGIAITSCDTIEGPIVKFKDGTVKKLKSVKEAKAAYKKVEEIIYLGDVLFPFSDLVNRNAELIKPGFVEEWWALELRKKSEEERKIDYFNISLEKAKKLSQKYKIPLHPNYIFYWTQISKKQFLALLDFLSISKFENSLVFPWGLEEIEKFSNGKRALELLGIEQDISKGSLILKELESRALLLNLGIDSKKENFSLKEEVEKIKKEVFDSEEDVLKLINSLSPFIIKDKAGDFIGARMGRPEKSKLRKLKGSPNVLFPVGSEGGRLRSVQEACLVGKIKNNFPLFYCEVCKKETVYNRCEDCGNKTKEEFYFPETKEKSFKKISEKEGRKFMFKTIDPKHFFDSAKKAIGFRQAEVPPLIKGVRGMFSSDKNLENLSKGILRAKHNLQVNKDGTIRFDATELPIVYFKPKEIFVSIEKLKSLGYTEDYKGMPLENENQILEIMPHDIILPSYDGVELGAEEVFTNVANFVDEELVKFYKMKPFYSFKKKEDLIGQLGVCMAPHNCAGVICRFIGNSKTQGLFASPYIHAAIRRDCDGDEAAIMLLGDVLLNFSRKFLPSHRGGTQDAPLVLNAKINAGEVDDQILDFEVVNEYPLELYEKAEKREHSSAVKIRDIKEVLKEGKDPFVGLGFTHDTDDLNEGVRCSSYKTLETMQDKLDHQLILAEKLRSVDEKDIAELVIDKHFLKDLKGNLRKFSIQNFRCVACNEIVRRPPLSGVCPACGGKLIFTINEGGIKKYLEPSIKLAEQYNLSTYMKQNLDLIKRAIEGIFGKELERQESIAKWF